MAKWREEVSFVVLPNWYYLVLAMIQEVIESKSGWGTLCCSSSHHCTDPPRMESGLCARSMVILPTGCWSERVRGSWATCWTLTLCSLSTLGTDEIIWSSEIVEFEFSDKLSFSGVPSTNQPTAFQSCLLSHVAERYVACCFLSQSAFCCSRGSYR